MSTLEFFLLITAALITLMAFVMFVKYLPLRRIGQERHNARPISESRRNLFRMAGAAAALVLTSKVLEPVAAWATHLRCTQSGAVSPYNTCIGLCTCTTSSCCVTSPNGVYRDCCSGSCSGTCTNCGRYRVVFRIDNRGGCFCYLRAC